MRKLITAAAGLLCYAISGLAQAEDQRIGTCIANFRVSDVPENHDVYYSDMFTVPNTGLEDSGHLELKVRDKLKDAFLEILDSPKGRFGSVSCGNYFIRNIEWSIEENEDYGYTVIRTNWVPDSSLWSDRKESSADKGVIRDDVFNPAVQVPIKEWMEQHKISSTEDIASTLALIVQTALVLQSFDPGPADGVFGKSTLAAMVAWQTMQGIPEGGELVGLIAAILRAALVLEGYDPGPVEEMFGPSAIEAAQAWAPSYEKAARNQGSRDRNDRLSPPTSWRTVPHAKDCVSFVRSGGAGNYQFIRNDCDFKIDVHWCYTDRPGDNDYCAPGRAGIGYMDRVGHRATRRGAGPDYYTSSEGLRPREMTRQPMRLGAIRYIACGHRPLRNAQQYVTEWDAHTAKFRCLAYAPEQDDRTPAEGTAE